MYTCFFLSADYVLAPDEWFLSKLFKLPIFFLLPMCVLVLFHSLSRTDCVIRIWAADEARKQIKNLIIADINWFRTVVTISSKPPQVYIEKLFRTLFCVASWEKSGILKIGHKFLKKNCVMLYELGNIRGFHKSFQCVFYTSFPVYITKKAIT